MLSLPDFKEKKIIFISNLLDTPNNLKYTNSNIRLYQGEKFTNQISLHLVFCIFIIGETTITSKIIQESSSRGISIFMLNDSFKVYASINSKAEGNYLLRQQQYTMSQNRELKIAKKLIENKIINQIKVLKVYGKESITDQKKAYLDTIISVSDYKELLGIEGNFAKKYFEELFSDNGWIRRSPRTRQDIDNFLLDIGYTFLFNYVDSLLNLFGFDNYKGVYHKLFFQRKSLTCDVMEPLRPLIDKQLIKSYNLKQINPKDFKFINNEYQFKDYKIRKKYINIWLQLLMDHREEIYIFVQKYYRFIINPKKYRYQNFRIK